MDEPSEDDFLSSAKKIENNTIINYLLIHDFYYRSVTHFGGKMKKSSMNLIVYMACISIALASCSQHPDKIPPQYVSPLQYDNYNCKQISSEMQRLSARASELHGKQEKSAKGDNIKTGVGIVLFWPTLFFLDNNSAQASEYAKIKGEFNALEQVAIQKNCGLQSK